MHAWSEGRIKISYLWKRGRCWILQTRKRCCCIHCAQKKLSSNSSIPAFTLLQFSHPSRHEKPVQGSSTLVDEWYHNPINPPASVKRQNPRKISSFSPLPLHPSASSPRRRTFYSASPPPPRRSLSLPHSPPKQHFARSASTPPAPTSPPTLYSAHPAASLP